MAPPFDQIVEPDNSLSRNKYTVKDLRFRRMVDQAGGCVSGITPWPLEK